MSFALQAGLLLLMSSASFHAAHGMDGSFTADDLPGIRGAQDSTADAIGPARWHGLRTAQAAVATDDYLRYRAALEAADADVQEARAELEAARHRLTLGEEPLPGERIGTVSGFSRLNEAYFERQQALRAAVLLAQQRLDRALARRRALLK